MTAIKRSISVSFEHQIYFTNGVFAAANPLLAGLLAGPAPGTMVLIVLDESLAQARPDLGRLIENYFAGFPDRLRLAGPPLIIEGGERAKNSYFHVSEIHSQVERYHLDRHSCIIGIGGGALLDIAGLAAATAHRGIRHIRLPTTTLSQCDAGVGVKNGINAFGKKNFIGTFAPPFAVINDFQWLATLSDRDRRAGCAEAVKVALIRDLDFFEQLERDAAQLAAFVTEAVQPMIRRSAELHVDHIASGGDPFETGSARPLDFGHWSAHKLEQLTDYQLRHGEAVAVGVALDVLYSRDIGFLDSRSCERVLSLLEKLGFDLFTNELLHQDSDQQWVVLKGLAEFREHLGGPLTLTMLAEIGRSVEIHEVNLPKMLDAMRELHQRHLHKSEVILSAPRSQAGQR